jgi:hypothetical protein
MIRPWSSKKSFRLILIAKVSLVILFALICASVVIYVSWSGSEDQ